MKYQYSARVALPLKLKQFTKPDLTAGKNVLIIYAKKFYCQHYTQEKLQNGYNFENNLKILPEPEVTLLITVAIAKKIFPHTAIQITSRLLTINHTCYPGNIDKHSAQQKIQ